MIIYNVTTKVTNNINEAWLQWMKQEHIPAIMATGLFHDYRISRLLEQDDNDGPTYSIQYFTDTLENYQTYLAEHAPRLRQLSYQLFGSQFVSFRTVMQVV
ncbi:protein of unknown function [Chitinophaga sp. CF118]|uniref:DUF4286 family protein n=1 Tax=Chitinophaga sp. CF118 TaxID=1884367 RepID=UPI0008E54E9C|nr:DUF4286 family protein [Chitinophaga sp. CF118]SFE71583.1 protein of unknown function [Chitinophaga sp. CF118]